MFHIAKRTLLVDLKIGTKQRIVMTTVAAIRKIIAVLTLSNMPAKSMFSNPLTIPPYPIAK
jgi:hypothetical protein